MLNESSSNPEKFWKSIKEIFPIKTKREQTTSSFLIKGEKTYDKHKIANGFCQFFTSVANLLKLKAFPLIDCVWNYKKKYNVRQDVAFNFSRVPVREVNSHLKNLKRNKAVGLDNIPPGFLKDVANVIAPPLTHIINLSLRNGVIPSDFKSGRVTPLFKSGSASNTDNYRPITILPILSKVLEKCVHDQVMKFLEENNLLCSQQFGFRKHRSTELAATCFVDDIRKGMDRGHYTGAIYVDLSKTFDTISHASILSKLPGFGIDGIAKEWFTNYLFGRSQQVEFENVLSAPSSIYCGVPQGSILGPLLFLLHFNDSVKTLLHCKIIKYADDSVLYVSDKDITIIEHLLNEDFANFCSWLQDNELIINTKKGKTEFMIFGTSIRLSRLNNPPMNLNYQGISVNNITSYKYLGISLNQTLNMTNHFSSAIKKASNRVNLLKRVRYFIDANAASTIYKSMVIPLLTYCPVVTACVSDSLFSRVEMLEKRAQRIVSIRKVVKIPSIASIIEKRCCTLVFKCLKGEVVQISTIIFNTYNIM